MKKNKRKKTNPKAVIFDLAAVAVFMTLCLHGCSNNSSNQKTEISESTESTEITQNDTSAVIYTAEQMLGTLDYDINDYVTLGDLESISIEQDGSSYEYTDEKLKETVTEDLTAYEFYKTTDKKTVEEGDTMQLTFSFTDGSKEIYADTLNVTAQMEEEDPEAEDYDYNVDTFLMRQDFYGDTVGKTFSYTFPVDDEVKDYLWLDDDCTYESVTYTVKIDGIVEKLPSPTYDELDDEMFENSEALVYFYGTRDEYLETMRSSLEDSLASEQAADEKTTMYDKLLSISEVKIPKSLQDSIESTIEDMQEEADSYSISMEDYLSMCGYSSEDEVIEEKTREAQQELLLFALVSKDNAYVDKEDMDTYYADYITYYGTDSVDDFYTEVFSSPESAALYYAEQAEEEELLNRYGNYQ